MITIWEKVLRAFKRFPLSFVSSIGFSFLLLWSFIDRDSSLSRVYYTLMIAIVIFLIIELREEGRRFTKKVEYAIGTTFLAYHYFVYLDNIEDLDKSVLFFREVILFSALFLTILYSKFTDKRDDNLIIWRWSRKIFYMLGVSFGVGAILFIGSLVAVGSISELFGIHLYSLFTEIMIITLFLIPNITFLSLLSNSEDREKSYSRVIEYILMVLTTIYFVILFAYSIVIIFSSEIPKGVISWMIIDFSMLGIVTYLYLTEREYKIKNIIFIAIFLQSFMLFYAIYLRVWEYGITENRYYLILFAIWLFGISLYFILNRKASYRVLFISLTILVLISQFGGFLSKDLAKASQSRRVLNLIQNKPKSHISEIEDILIYLISHHGRESIKEILPELKVDNRKLDEFYSVHAKAKYVMERLNLLKKRYKYIFYMSVSSNIPKHIKGYDIFYPNMSEYDIRKSKDLNMEYKDEILKIFYKDREIFTISKKKLLERFKLSSNEEIDRGRELKYVYLKKDLMTFYSKDRKTKIIFLRISLDDDNDNDMDENKFDEFRVEIYISL